MSIEAKELPDSSKWMTYLDGMDNAGAIFFANHERQGRLFHVKDSLTLAVYDTLHGVCHQVPKYRITTTENEIRIVNLLSKNLIADYATSLSWPPQAIPKNEAEFQFYVDESVFDEPARDLIVP
jgi:hypothetical protein